MAQAFAVNEHAVTVEDEEFWHCRDGCFRKRVTVLLASIGESLPNIAAPTALQAPPAFTLPI